MSINAWVDQGNEINGSGSDFFADDLAMDACGTIIAAGNFGNASGISGFGYKYNSGTGTWVNQNLNQEQVKIWCQSHKPSVFGALGLPFVGQLSAFHY